ncbi:9031_t:CDS:1, partial [Scutellospora calospora]
GKNPNSAIFVIKVIDKHNYYLNVNAIMFEFEKKFSMEMIENIKFLTQHCKIDATAQIKYLEGKYPVYPIYSKDLYAVIRKFCLIAKSLLNDTAQISDC